jgi:hypothetical protein
MKTKVCLEVAPIGKVCTGCDEFKLLDEYHRASDGKFGRAARCRDCEKNDQRKWVHQLRTNFGITSAEYDRMLADQHGVCALCDLPNENGKRLAVDHCHDTGRVRQLLCSNCNTAIGLLKDNPALMRMAAAYVEKHAATPRSLGQW